MAQSRSFSSTLGSRADSAQGGPPAPSVGRWRPWLKQNWLKLSLTALGLTGLVWLALAFAALGADIPIGR